MCTLFVMLFDKFSAHGKTVSQSWMDLIPIWIYKYINIYIYIYVCVCVCV